VREPQNIAGRKKMTINNRDAAGLVRRFARKAQFTGSGGNGNGARKGANRISTPAPGLGGIDLGGSRGIFSEKMRKKCNCQKRVGRLTSSLGAGVAVPEDLQERGVDYNRRWGRGRGVTREVWKKIEAKLNSPEALGLPVKEFLGGGGLFRRRARSVRGLREAYFKTSCPRDSSAGGRKKSFVRGEKGERLFIKD